MRVFVDTSGLLALLDKDDINHAHALRCWNTLQPEELCTTNYVLVETLALVQSRLGIPSVNILIGLLSALEVIWVTDDLHHAGLARLLQEGRRRLSFVDCVSFEYMAREGVTIAFAYDRHFTEAGFILYSPSV